MRVYSPSYWLAIFCTTNNSRVLAREGWQNFENSWKKTQYLKNTLYIIFQGFKLRESLCDSFYLNADLCCWLNSTEIKTNYALKRNTYWSFGNKYESETSHPFAEIMTDQPADHPKFHFQKCVYKYEMVIIIIIIEILLIFLLKGFKFKCIVRCRSIAITNLFPHFHTQTRLSHHTCCMGSHDRVFWTFAQPKIFTTDLFQLNCKFTPHIQKILFENI